VFRLFFNDVFRAVSLKRTIEYMNVYDFDGTIYNGDSSIDFYLYCLRKRPKIATAFWRQISGVLYCKVGKINTTQMKERFFSFLSLLDDTEALVISFWKKHKRKIYPWYLAQKNKDDVVISASPFFLLQPICKEIGIMQLIATQMNLHSGKITGRNCKGREKVRRFYNQFPGTKIQCFYSDSLTDAPLAEIAEKAFLVKKKRFHPWSN